MNNFNIPKGWQTPLTMVIALLVVTAIGFSARAIRSAAAKPTPVEIVQASATPRPRPTVPPTFTPTPSPTVPSSPTATFTPSPTATNTPTPQPTPIIVDVTKLGNLTSAQFKMQTVVTQSRNNENWWQGIFGNDKVVMLVVGNVFAGIDMAEIPEKGIQISGSSILLSIPHATVNTVELLPGESTVIDSEKKWLMSDYPGLEATALDAAKQELQQWAINDAGILPVADKLAKAELTEFLQKLGFKSITITFNNSED